MHDLGRGGEQRSQYGAPFLEGGRFAKTHGVVFQRLPPHQQQEVFGILDALAHFHFVESLGRSDMRSGFGEGGLEGFGLAWFHGDEGTFQDHRALRIFAAMGSSVAASTMPRAWGASGAPSLRGMMWKWT